MHAHEVEFQIRHLNNADSYETAETLVSELSTYSGILTKDQFQRLCEVIISNNFINNCDACKDNLKAILKKSEENADESSYKTVLEMIN